jgi:hypothetical protein
MVACRNGADNAVTLPPTFIWQKDPGEGSNHARKRNQYEKLDNLPRIIGEVQRLGNRPVRNAEIVQPHRHQSTMQAGLCSGIIKLFRNRRAILAAQLKSYHATFIIHTSDVIKLCAQEPKILRREVY